MCLYISIYNHIWQIIVPCVMQPMYDGRVNFHRLAFRAPYSLMHIEGQTRSCDTLGRRATHSIREPTRSPLNRQSTQRRQTGPPSNCVLFNYTIYINYKHVYKYTRTFDCIYVTLNIYGSSCNIVS